MADWSIHCPDLCWFRICEHLSVRDIAQLGSTCRTLHQMFWSRESPIWTYLIRLKFPSSSLFQATTALSNETDDEESIVAENDRFSRRLSDDVQAYERNYQEFTSRFYWRSWHSCFIGGKKEIRGYFAFERFTYPDSLPLLNDPVQLSSKLWRLYYYR